MYSVCHLKTLKATVLVVCLFFIAACQSVPSIHVLKDQDTNLNRYKTFGFHPALDNQGEQYDSLTDQYLKSAIRGELLSKGFVYSDTPDLWVNFNVFVTEKLRVRTTTPSFYYYGFRQGYGVWANYPLMEDRIEQYSEGTLNIDLVDRQKNQLVWEGIAIGKVNKKALDNLQEKINQAVSLIFEKLP